MDEIGDLDAMEITTRLNGEVMQNATADLRTWICRDSGILFHLRGTQAR